MKYLLTTILAVLAFTACSHDNSSESNGQGRTVIVYMAAENNLSSIAQVNINDMIIGAKKLGSKDRLLVFVDRQNPQEKPFIIRLTGNAKQLVDTVYQFNNDFYSSDSEEMKQILGWCMKEYPNDSYGLVLWGHADGWLFHNTTTPKASTPSIKKAFGQDSGKDLNKEETKWMEITEMRDALAALPHTFKFIFADCCAFQNVEVAYELRNTTDYIIASPAEIPGAGAPYANIIPAMFNKTDATMYQQICDRYNEAGGTGNRVPISTVNTAKLSDLASATHDIISNELNGKTFNMDGLVYYYNNVNYVYRAERIMYDMMDFLRQNTGNEAYLKWRQTYDAAVVYKKKSSKWDTNGLVDFDDFTVTDDNFGGMSMFVPLNRYNSTQKNYNELIKQMEWYNAAGWSSIGW